MERSVALLEAEHRVFDAKLKSLERAWKSKKKPSAVGQLQKAHAAELALERAIRSHTADKYDAALNLVAVCN